MAFFINIRVVPVQPGNRPLAGLVSFVMLVSSLLAPPALAMGGGSGGGGMGGGGMDGGGMGDGGMGDGGMGGGGMGGGGAMNGGMNGDMGMRDHEMALQERKSGQVPALSTLMKEVERKYPGRILNVRMVRSRKGSAYVFTIMQENRIRQVLVPLSGGRAPAARSFNFTSGKKR